MKNVIKNDGRGNNSYRKHETKKECDVIDLYGNHCPNEPTRTIDRDDERLYLCEACYQALVAGAYGKNIANDVSVPIPHPPTENMLAWLHKTKR